MSTLPNVYTPKRRLGRIVAFRIVKVSLFLGMFAGILGLLTIGGLKAGKWLVVEIKQSYAELRDEVNKPVEPGPVRWPDGFDPRDADGVYPDDGNAMDDLADAEPEQGGPVLRLENAVPGWARDQQ